jgi:1,2-diacylglycerol 3-beta-galactosyltransferase
VSPERRVLVLTSDTGAGHRSVSNALIAEARLRPERGLDLVDADPFTPLPPYPEADGPSYPPSVMDRIAPLYGPMIVHTPWLWGLTFKVADNDLGLAAYLAAVGGALTDRLVAAIQRSGADAVVSVHPLVNHLMVRARERLGRPDLPLLTVVTDLVDVHRWWATPRVDHFVVGSNLAAEKLFRLGVAPARVSVLGIPIRREFCHVTSTASETRARLGLDPSLTTVLIMGGGDGAGRIPQNAQAIAALAKRGAPRFQLVVLTGRNRRARIELEAESWPIPTTIHGIVSQVADYMIAADLIVTKPGSLTVSEALALGRPMLLGRPLPGQEEGNIPYVVESGAGMAYRNPTEAAEAGAFLLRDPSTRWEMGQNAARIGKPAATERTLDLLQGLMLQAERAA